MISARSRSTQKRYAKHRATKPAGCEFCNFTSDMPRITSEHKYFWVTPALFGYDVWDGTGVVEHLMIVPKRHVESVSQFTLDESKEFFELVSQHEATGYSIYSRAAGSAAKTVPHQHTHLIKLDNKHKRAVFFVRKPHFIKYI